MIGLVVMNSGACLIEYLLDEDHVPEINEWIAENDLEHRVVRFLDGSIFTIEVTNEDLLSLTLRFNI